MENTIKIRNFVVYIATLYINVGGFFLPIYSKGLPNFNINPQLRL